MAFDFLILSFIVTIITSTCLSVEVIENVFWQVSVGGDFNSLPNRWNWLITNSRVGTGDRIRHGVDNRADVSQL